jgi:hypothetical protein
MESRGVKQTIKLTLFVLLIIDVIFLVNNSFAEPGLYPMIIVTGFPGVGSHAMAAKELNDNNNAIKYFFILHFSYLKFVYQLPSSIHNLMVMGNSSNTKASCSHASLVLLYAQANLQ